MTKYHVSTFKNNEGQIVHAVFVEVPTAEGNMVERHQGTFATLKEAEDRVRVVLAEVSP